MLLLALARQSAPAVPARLTTPHLCLETLRSVRASVDVSECPRTAIGEEGAPCGLGGACNAERNLTCCENIHFLGGLTSVKVGCLAASRGAASNCCNDAHLEAGMWMRAAAAVQPPPPLLLLLLRRLLSVLYLPPDPAAAILICVLCCPPATCRSQHASTAAMGSYLSLLSANTTPPEPPNPLAMPPL